MRFNTVLTFVIITRGSKTNRATVKRVKNGEKVRNVGAIPCPRCSSPACLINKSILYKYNLGQWVINGQGTPLLGQQC